MANKDEGKRPPTSATGGSPDTHRPRIGIEIDEPKANPGTASASSGRAEPAITVPDFPKEKTPERTSKAELNLASIIANQGRIIEQMQKQNQDMAEAMLNISSQQKAQNDAMTGIFQGMNRKQEQLQEKWEQCFTDADRRNEILINKLQTVTTGTSGVQDVQMEGPMTLEELIKTINDSKITKDVQTGIERCIKTVTQHARNFEKTKSLQEKLEHQKDAYAQKKDPPSSRPFKVYVEFEQLDDKIGEQKELEIKYEANTTIRERMEALHFFYMREMRELEILTCQRRKVALKTKSTFEAFSQLIDKEVNEPRSRDLKDTEYAEKNLFQNNETLTTTIQLRLYRNMVLNLKEDVRRQREQTEQSVKIQQKLEEKASTVDPKLLIYDAVRQVQRHDKEISKKTKFSGKAVEIDYVKMYENHICHPNDPVLPVTRSRTHTTAEIEDYKSFLGSAQGGKAQPTGKWASKSKGKGKKGKYGKGKNRKGKNKGKGKKGKNSKGKNRKGKNKGKGKKGKNSKGKWNKGKTGKGKGKGKGKGWKGKKSGTPKGKSKGKQQSWNSWDYRNYGMKGKGPSW